MREIKFRAWDKKNKKMRKVLTMAFAELSGMNIEVQGLVGYHFLDNPRHTGTYFELLQYTGLKDKNGKEIYEGDIVKAHLEEAGDSYGDGWNEPHEENYWAEKDIYGEVRIRIVGGTRMIVRKIFCEEEDEEPHMIKGSFIRIKKCDEIIGNIYENPELLESDK